MNIKKYRGKHFRVYFNAKTEDYDVCVPENAELEDINTWIEKCCVVRHLLNDVIVIYDLMGVGKSLECDALRLTAKVEVNYEEVVQTIFIVDFEEMKLYKGER